MSTFSLECRDERRRQLIRERHLNGIDYIEVVGKHLCVHFLTGIPPELLPKKKGGTMTDKEKAEAIAHIVIKGGRRVTDLHIVGIKPDETESKYEESCLGIELDREGDWSQYTLCFVETKDGHPTSIPLKSLDPRYACLDFRFRIDCAAELDCKPEGECEPEQRPGPAISYLAKDYASFRQLILDRLALTMPQWRERDVPDIGVALVELLAYVGDYLSYYQDSVAAEQYFDTARQRISVRRHARLVDYAMHEGCNARAFVHLHVQNDVELDPHTFFFSTEEKGGVIFEPLSERPAVRLRIAHNAIVLYTWGSEECCLPKGAMRATLLDELKENDKYDPAICDESEPPPPDHDHDEHCKCGYKPPPPRTPRALDLEAGDFLLFEELACAGTVFNSEKPGDGGFDGVSPQPDADHTHRHVVRITKVTKGCDALRGNRVLEVEWSREDALPFALCVSAIGTAPQCDLVRNMAVARGNILLADHGATIVDEELPPVPPRRIDDTCEGEDALADEPRIAARYRPNVKEAPLTFAQPFVPKASATASVRQDPRSALPAIVLGAIEASFDGLHPLLTPSQLANIDFLIRALVSPDDPLLIALKRRLRPAVRALIDEGGKDPELPRLLSENLRELMETWSPRADLLDSGPDDAVFVAEVDDAGAAHLRFGEGDTGRAVEPGMAFLATYRAGNGRDGLVGPEAINFVFFREGTNDAITNARNPLPSAGAADPEPVQEVKMYAPGAFRKILGRAVTAEDYATLAQYLRFPERNPRVQSAAAMLTWTGSWYEADVGVDPFGTSDLDPELREGIENLLYRYRRMGHDLRVESAHVVPLRLEIAVCIKPEYLRAHVLSAVRDTLSSRALPGGRRGFFHPDNLTFGGAIYISRIVAAVMAVDGVLSTIVTRLERLAHEKQKPREKQERPRGPDLDFENGFLRLRPDEIARLDNDPAIPENGVFDFSYVGGGR